MSKTIQTAHRISGAFAPLPSGWVEAGRNYYGNRIFRHPASGWRATETWPSERRYFWSAEVRDENNQCLGHVRSLKELP